MEAHYGRSRPFGSQLVNTCDVIFVDIALESPVSSMDILKQLFEQHFHQPAERIQPLQGQLGGSGRNIVRLAGGKISAIGILYGVREENAAFIEFSRHFRRHGLPVPEIYAENLDQGAYLEEDFGDTTLFEFLSKNRTGEQHLSGRNRCLSQSCGHAATLSDRSRPRPELQSLLSARQFRPPVHQLGFELFQILLSSAGRHSV